MAENTHESINPPYEMKLLDSENVAIIEENLVRFVEMKRLGASTMEVNIADITEVETLPGDEGDMVIIRRKRGNSMRIGPLDSEVAAAGHALLNRLIAN